MWKEKISDEYLSTFSLSDKAFMHFESFCKQNKILLIFTAGIIL